MSARRPFAAPCAAGTALPCAAGGAGLPLPNQQTARTGAVAPGGSERLITRTDGRTTTVLALRRDNRSVLRSSRIDGRWAVPAVTLDNDTTGLSADRGTLVLAHRVRAFPPRRARLGVVGPWALDP